MGPILACACTYDWLAGHQRMYTSVWLHLGISEKPEMLLLSDLPNREVVIDEVWNMEPSLDVPFPYLCSSHPKLLGPLSGVLRGSRARM